MKPFYSHPSVLVRVLSRFVSPRVSYECAAPSLLFSCISPDNSGIEIAAEYQCIRDERAVVDLLYANNFCHRRHNKIDCQPYSCSHLKEKAKKTMVS